MAVVLRPSTPETMASPPTSPLRCSQEAATFPTVDYLGDGRVDFRYLMNLVKEKLTELGRKPNYAHGRYDNVGPYIGYSVVYGSNAAWIGFSKEDLYIERPKRPSPYIATCAPLPLDLGIPTFWSMLAKNTCSTLVILTPFEKDKAENYLLEEPKCSIDCGWPVYQYDLFRAAQDVRVFHVKDWADCTEGDVENLLKLVQTVYKDRIEREAEGPIATHCSAGVGRTGVFIGCYEIYKRVMQGERPTLQDIFTIAAQMRLQRTGLGGNVEQYHMLFSFAEHLQN
ncbi:MAG: hypothetical protein JSS61_03340 [Verrucomicrobia bacterium]|nr:hypothetical protein [Verrucomicrobiota bacterium]